MARFLKARFVPLSIAGLAILCFALHGEQWRINFQPSGSTVPAGYEKDDGSWYETHGDWGWVTDDDEDGLPDWWEVKYLGSMDYGPEDDPDMDGLTNLEEHGYGTDPGQRDTDSDGWWDGFEVERGSDPLSHASYPSPGVAIFYPEDGSEL